MPEVFVGTSGFSYKEWKPAFYPQDLPDKRMLPYYASRFPTVEIDSTFYRMPTAATLDAWRNAVPSGFRFVIKASQVITHRQRLRVPSDALSYLTTTVTALGSNLAFIAYQLPPVSRYDLSRLQAFLEVLPSNVQAAFEFRHPSWFVPEVYELLRKHQSILCIHDTEEGCSPLELTGPAVYVRLRRDSYSSIQQEEWRRRFKDWAASGRDVFAYIKHKDNPNAPQIALAFAEGF
ncbi:MAG TPA: DUF72 domain-containing protein [Terriglobia bacterium]|nr:DUF72 domain-containing protein [Terriglobia bacterium]